MLYRAFTYSTSDVNPCHIMHGNHAANYKNFMLYRAFTYSTSDVNPCYIMHGNHTVKST